MGYSAGNYILANCNCSLHRMTEKVGSLQSSCRVMDQRWTQGGPWLDRGRGRISSPGRQSLTPVVQRQAFLSASLSPTFLSQFSPRRYSTLHITYPMRCLQCSRRFLLNRFCCGSAVPDLLNHATGCEIAHWHPLVNLGFTRSSYT
jgi:hypothetical protein